MAERDIASLRDGRREPLSRLQTRHGRPGLTLTLKRVTQIPMDEHIQPQPFRRGRCGVSPQKGSDETAVGSAAGEGFPLLARL